MMPRATATATIDSCMDVIEQIFSPAGVLSRAIPGYRRRSQQVEMARAVAQAIESNGRLDRRGRHRHRQDLRLPRAGAAVGRQGDHLHRHQDAAGPALRPRHADGARRAARSRSRSRCSRAAPTTSATTISSAPLAEGRFAAREDARHLPRSRASRAHHERGDRADCADVPEDAPSGRSPPPRARTAWARECRHYERVLRDEGAQAGAAADVVVVNHHLFFADVVLRDEGRRRAAARVQHGDLRRGAPAAGHGEPVLRRAACRPRS